MPGAASDIGIGINNGTVWAIGTDRGIYRWSESGFHWEQIDGSADRIAVDSDGNPWVVVSSPADGVFACDIGVGDGGNAWIIGHPYPNAEGVNCDPNINGGVYQRVNGVWEQKDGGAVSISVGYGGKPWVVNSGGGIFRYNR
jgi:virginiamycin B lyase